MFLRKFHAVQLDIKIMLFDMLCMDLYGADLSWNNEGCSSILNSLAVSYHYALKRILGLPKRSSNHYACYLLDKPIFKHLLNFRMLKLYRWLVKSNSICLSVNKLWLLNHSSLKIKLDAIFHDVYGIDDIIENDIDAIFSRIIYVQNREEASWSVNDLVLN